MFSSTVGAMTSKILIFLGLVCVGGLTSATAVTQPSGRGLFAADLFKEVTKGGLNKNVIISPISIQAAMAMVFMGSEGETANELQKGLRLSSSDKQAVGQEFSEAFKVKKGEAQLAVANKIYVNFGYKLRSTYNDLLSTYFHSEAERVDFSQGDAAVETINNWIANATHDKIKNILQPEFADSATGAVIVNAIYFKGNWQWPFDQDSTSDSPFWVSNTESVDIKMMQQLHDYLYGDFPEFGATAIELPYKDSDLSMLILLPNERDGLAELEEKLGSVALNGLSSRMKEEHVEVQVPRFKIEFKISVNDALKSLGIESIFGSNANLSGIFEGSSAQISNVQHKAFIDVNEEGSEATGSTVVISDRLGPGPWTKNFKVDHPFVYAIKSSSTVYFVGHFARPL